MAQVNALLYPACYVKRKVGLAASLFLDQLLVLAPSSDCAEEVSSSMEIGGMKISALLAAPLGERLDEFKNGVRALEKWGEEMGLGRGTSFETLYSALSSSRDEDIRGIIGAIKGGNKKDIMLASRLFLRLSMDADRRLDELEKELQKVEGEEMKISELVGGTGDAGSSPGVRNRYLIEPLNKPRERLRAWIRTSFEQEGQPCKCIPLGESIAIKDLMDSAYESISGGRPAMQIASFSLPDGLAGLCKENKAPGIKPAFARLLELLSQKEEGGLSGLSQDQKVKNAIQEVQTAIDKACTHEQGNTGAFWTITAYPDSSWQAVILEAAQIKGIDATRAPVEPTKFSLFIT